MSKVVFEVEARHAGAIQKFLQFQRVVEGSGKTLERMGNRGARAGRRMTGRMAGFGRSILQTTMLFTGFGATLGAIAATVMVIRREYDFMKSRKIESGEFALRADPGLRKLRASFGESKPGDKITNVDEWVAKLKTDIVATGLIPDLGRAAEISAATISVSGQQISKDKLFKNIETMAKIAGPSMELEAASGMSAAMTILQQRKEDITARGAAGRVVHLLKSIPQKDFQTAAKNVLPGIGSAMTAGLTFEQAGAAFTGISQTSADIQGRRSATALTTSTIWAREAQMEMAKRDKRIQNMQFSDFYNSLFQLTDVYQFKDDKKVQRLMQAGRIRFMGGMYMGEREGISPRGIESEKRMAERLLPGLKEASFQQKTKMGTLGLADVRQQLATEGAHPRELYKDFIKRGVPTEKQYQDMTDKLILEINSTSTSQVTRLDALLRGTQESLRAARTGEQAQGVLLKQLEPLIKQMKGFAIEAKYKTFKEAITPGESIEDVRRRFRKDFIMPEILELSRKRDRNQNVNLRRRQDDERIRREGGRRRATPYDPAETWIGPMGQPLTKEQELTLQTLLKMQEAMFLQDEINRKQRLEVKKRRKAAATEGSAIGTETPLEERLNQSLDRNSEAIEMLSAIMGNQKMKVEIDDKAGTALHQTTTLVTPAEEHLGDGIIG